MTEECGLSTGKLPLGGLLRNSVVEINRCPDMISVVYLNVNSAINLSTDQPNRKVWILIPFMLLLKDLQYGNVLNALRKLVALYGGSLNHTCICQ